MKFLIQDSISRSTVQLENENVFTTSRSSDIESGPAFSSSFGRDDDSLSLKRQQIINNTENNRDFEFIEREIGMCRPVCYCFSILFL